jgi:hypothetical protein
MPHTQSVSARHWPHATLEMQSPPHPISLCALWEGRSAMADEADCRIVRRNDRYGLGSQAAPALTLKEYDRRREGSHKGPVKGP